MFFATEYLFIRFATKFNIIDNPNDRSSHTHITVRGGGIIFWVAALVYFTIYFATQTLFFIGLTLISIISFIDDIHKLHQGARFFVHFGAVTLVIFATGLYTFLPWYLVFVVYIMFIGMLNAYNFMDGINGLTGLHSISVQSGLQYINTEIVQFANQNFIWFPIIACIVFLFFNFRKQALCFAGDIGSLSIAFWIITLLIMLMIKTGSVIWILLLATYGVDSVCTILHRIWLRQNIFEAPRLHFYQILANEKKIDHRLVSIGYAILQLLISAMIIFLNCKLEVWVLVLAALSPLTIIYGFKFRMLKME